VKILLLNDNPVVTKLVTLSAQKTDDTVEAAHSLDEVPSGSYDLLVIDDALYSKEDFEALKEKVKFKKSLFVCSREKENEEGFSAKIKKPFLPTDLVELFTNLKRNLDVVADENGAEEITEDELLEDLELEGLDDIEGLDEELDLDDLDLDLEDEETAAGESVLDDEEAQKVKDLLEETQETQESEEDLDLDFDLALDLEDEADADISEPEKDQDLEELGIDENIEDEAADISLDEAVDLEMEELALEEDIPLEEAVSEEFAEEAPADIEEQIQEAVEELSDEDLESEVDEETLLEIASNEIDSFANLNSKELKAALGEESSDDEHVDEDENETAELVAEPQEHESVTDASKNGVESLKVLLAALSDENIAASLKGAKITINISFED
jgi:uncharacterized membrane protein